MPSETAHLATLAQLVAPERLAPGGPLEHDRPAITDGTVELTWAEYVEHVDTVARHLVAAGVAPGDRVVIRMLKSVWSFVGVHGALRAGGVATPIDPLAPSAHAAAVVEDAGATVGLCDARSARGLVAPDRPLAAVLDVSELATSTAPAGTELPQVGPDDPAYIIYTSGSTGRPKGIVHTHRSGLAYARTAAAEYELTANDRFANIAPLQFDQSTFELYTAALVGATVVTVPDVVLRFPASLATLVADQRVTVWYSVPFVLEQLVARGALEDRDLTSVRWILFGGEAFAADRLDALRAAFPAAVISNVYGPAEVNQCTRYDVEPGDPLDPDVPIGGAWSAADVRMVDPDDVTRRLDGEGVGRLLVSSETAMAGYWGRPDLTDRVFHDLDGRRWYDTGDLVRRRDDGLLVFVGRVDNQVKVRGHRVELEAVDAALSECDGVGAATTVVHRAPADAAEGRDGARLVALVVGVGPGADPGDLASAVRSAVSARLPAAMVPDEVRVVDDLPRTSSGKIDRPAAARLLSPTSPA